LGGAAAPALPRLTGYANLDKSDIHKSNRRMTKKSHSGKFAAGKGGLGCEARRCLFVAKSLSIQLLGSSKDFLSSLALRLLIRFHARILMRLESAGGGLIVGLNEADAAASSESRLALDRELQTIKNAE
jgi:hypothetical protein